MRCPVAKNPNREGTEIVFAVEMQSEAMDGATGSIVASLRVHTH